ncbi:hypothetical protein AB3F22_06995 [Actinomyces johnsonii]|uniref:hypothetical protein n=1 Tax=Actinomyces johnsonii TaxID=544581 RepID=UPI001E375F45|nr:hypothetical protein [Actinomyces johnsonii]
MSRSVQAGAGQLVEGWGEQGAEGSAGAGVGEVDRVRSDSSPTVIASSFFSSAVLTTRLLTSCILIHWPASIRTVACSFAWQDDPSLIIDQWVDQHPLEEHLVEQLL